MTWSMFLIGWLELAERKKAADMLQRSYQYISTEFQVQFKHDVNVYYLNESIY